MSAHRRGPWSQQEDAYLMRLVQIQGALNWVRIAQTLGSRTPKQCRERYHQNLKPTLNHEPITPEEGHQIEALVRGIGKRWAEIARRLNGRSDNAVKNWWNGSQNRRKRLDRRRISQPLRFDTRRYGTVALSKPSLSLTSSLPRNCLMVTSPTSNAHYAPGHYSIQSPLLSPSSTGSPGSDVMDSNTYFPSEPSTGYTLSSLASTASASLASVDLPPIVNLTQASPSSPRFPAESKLPGLGSLLTTRGASDDSQSRLPPLTGSHLPTAPNSPTYAPPLDSQVPASGSSSPWKDSRMNVSALLA